MYSTDNVLLNSKHVNSNISYNLLSDQEMMAVGFRKTTLNTWYLSKIINTGEGGDISFNVSLPIDYDNNLLSIDVLDENFLQPYDFQYILRQNPSHEFANKIAKAVEQQMDILQEKEILSGHQYGEYI